MAQKGENEGKLSEFSRLFPSLDEGGKDRALSILNALDFAQSVLCRGEKLPRRPSQGSEGTERDTGVD